MCDGDLHPKFELRPNHVWKYDRELETSNLRRLRIGEEKRRWKIDKRRNHRPKI